MHIRIGTRSENALEKNEYRDIYSLSIDNEDILYFADGEPEDNDMRRNFNDVYQIDEVIKVVYKAGLRGEELNLDFFSIEE